MRSAPCHFSQFGHYQPYLEMIESPGFDGLIAVIDSYQKRVAEGCRVKAAASLDLPPQLLFKQSTKVVKVKR